VNISEPDGSLIPVKIEDLGDGLYNVAFTPEHVVPISVDVALGGAPLT